MRVLFLTNYYPPYELGGQGRSCLQVVEGLRNREHDVLVLTSMHGTNNVPVLHEGIKRSLYLEMDMVPWRHGVNFFTNRKAREAHNLSSLNRTLSEFDPDVVYIWGMWNFPRSLPAEVEARKPGRVIYRFADYWPTLPSQHVAYWNTKGRKWYSQLPKRLFARIALKQLDSEKRNFPLQFEHAICVSGATRDHLVEGGIPISHARIIHTGIDIEPFMPLSLSKVNNGQPLRLLYAGRLSATKGIETAINAMSILVHDRKFGRTTLSLAGSGSKAYESHLRNMISEERVNDNVKFLGLIPHTDMPSLMKKFDVLLVPSIWEEPFARVVLEGMIAGLAVIATPNGGTKEIIKTGENGLLFSAGDAEDLALKTIQLIENPTMRYKLAESAQQTILQTYTKNKMMDRIEEYLKEVACSDQGYEQGS